jgi:hypothetical protein
MMFLESKEDPNARAKSISWFLSITH